MSIKIPDINGLVDSAFSGLDELFTSDEERGKLQLAMEQLKANLSEKMLDLRKAMAAAITARHQADMQSDSWLAKNVRPLVLITMTVTTLLYLAVGLFLEFPDNATDLHPKYLIYTAGLSALVALDMVVYGFYFGSRGVEKTAAKVTESIIKAREAAKARRKREEDEEKDLLFG